MARVLALDAKQAQRVLILDEFTSMVDRPTAKRMARGLQTLLKSRTVLQVLRVFAPSVFAMDPGARKLTAKVVVVSCHSDFVGRQLGHL